MNAAVTKAKIKHISNYGKSIAEVDDVVISEAAVTIMIKDVGSFTLLATPTDLTALAIGFAFSEGIINSYDEVLACKEHQEPLGVTIEVTNPEQVTTQRNLIMTSSCGMCGSRNLERLIQQIRPMANSLIIPVEQLDKIMQTLPQRQQLFQQTGGAHAAAIFNQQGEIVTFAEDIGRHNALDKAIGMALLNSTNLQACGLILSSRISFEMVSKAAKAGLEIIFAVSAPSSLALDAANKWNITMLGFCRSGRANIYTHAKRIVI